MIELALIVPVMVKFDLFANLMSTVDVPVRPYVLDNWNHNRGVSPSWNEGMRNALGEGYKYALISNDDVTFAPGSIKQMYDLIKLTNACVISANQNGAYVSDNPVEASDFFCFMVDIPQLINYCGWFDENFTPAYFEDNDMDYRMRLAGVKGYVNPHAVAYHVGSATQNANPGSPNCPPHQFEQNRSYYINKWGGNPGQETYTKPFNDESKTIKDW